MPVLIQSLPENLSRSTSWWIRDLCARGIPSPGNRGLIDGWELTGVRKPVSVSHGTRVLPDFVAGRWVQALGSSKAKQTLLRCLKIPCPGSAHGMVSIKGGSHGGIESVFLVSSFFTWGKEEVVGAGSQLRDAPVLRSDCYS